jgi:3-isopropylmalate/(R)-2-methylmalate dehydratase small subunit
MPMINVDTDMIIPKQYPEDDQAHRARQGAVRRDALQAEDGSENPISCSTSRPIARRKILVAGDNFGCGSSREHAPWALLDFGIRCVISTSFADIFYNNCFKNGILPIKVSPEELEKLMDDAERGANAVVTVDLEARRSGARWRHDPVRDRPVPQAVPARGPRRHRPDPEEGHEHRQLRKPKSSGCSPG